MLPFGCRFPSVVSLIVGRVDFYQSPAFAKNNRIFFLGPFLPLFRRGSHRRFLPLSDPFVAGGISHSSLFRFASHANADLLMGTIKSPPVRAITKPVPPIERLPPIFCFAR
jgi:hypothetical protein